MTNEFWRDKNIDSIIQDIIDIFTKVEGVQLVRLSGLTNRAQKISGINISKEAVDNIIRKLKSNGIINYKYIMNCPHCKEISYQVIDRDINTPKLCDTCKTIYNLIDNTTLEREK